MQLWSRGVLAVGAIHLIAVLGTGLYCLDNYYDRICPLDTYVKVLAYPALLVVEHTALPKALNLLLLLLNSWLWGVAILSVTLAAHQFLTEGLGRNNAP